MTLEALFRVTPCYTMLRNRCQSGVAKKVGDDFGSPLSGYTMLHHVRPVSSASLFLVQKSFSSSWDLYTPCQDCDLSSSFQPQVLLVTGSRGSLFTMRSMVIVSQDYDSVVMVMPILGFCNIQPIFCSCGHSEYPFIQNKLAASL